jgi:hypothetical protein
MQNVTITSILPLTDFPWECPHPVDFSEDERRELLPLLSAFAICFELIGKISNRVNARLSQLGLACFSNSPLVDCIGGLTIIEWEKHENIALGAYFDLSCRRDWHWAAHSSLRWRKRGFLPNAIIYRLVYRHDHSGSFKI